MTNAAGRRGALLEELERPRAAFLDAVDDVEPDLLTTPGLVGDWSARDLVVHVAWWSEHGARGLGLAASGRGDEWDYHPSQTDAINARVAEEAQGVSPAEARSREESAFDAFRSALAGLATELLDLRLGNGDRVEDVIRYDGTDHYAEHAAHLRAWWTGDDEAIGDEEDEAELAEIDGESDPAG